MKTNTTTQPVKKLVLSKQSIRVLTQPKDRPSPAPTAECTVNCTA